MTPDDTFDSYIRFITKTVPFRFRGIDFSFALSQGLFSSADIDSGTRFLLKVFSRLLDGDIAAGKPLPRFVLDSGCGVGVIGVCAAAAINAAGGDTQVRAQDRDELARLLTVYNARKNLLPPAALEAFTEPLLAGAAGWDLILTNIPAKAGRPVLEDFVSRSAGLLNPHGRVVMVAVRPLADFFRECIAACGARLDLEETGAEHHVFVYGGKTPTDTARPAAVTGGEGFTANFPFYRRSAVTCEIEEIPLRIETVYGAPDFDWPDGAALAAAKLVRRLGPAKLRETFTRDNAAILVHESGQGFFPCFLLEFLHRECRLPSPPRPVLSGRNILALEAARFNCDSLASQAPLTARAARGETALVIPAADLCAAKNVLPAAAQRFGIAATFPELLPQSSLAAEADQLASLWESAAALVQAGGVFIAGFGSTAAERFDRKKPPAFTRLGDIKRKGFRALAYRLTAQG